MKITHENLFAPVISDMEELQKIVAALRVLGQKLVLTQGVWDMFHPGHARYIAKARMMGDVLFVGVDSDEMARLRKKGKWPPRPFDPYNERIEIISWGRSVDFVVSHANLGDLDDTLRIIQPDVFVTSMSTGPEIQTKLDHFLTFAKVVENWPPQASTSTTAKNRKLAGEVFEEFRTITQKAIDEVGKDGNIEHLHQKLQTAFDELEQRIKA